MYSFHPFVEKKERKKERERERERERESERERERSMLAWCQGNVKSPFGDATIVHWAVPDASDAHDSLPHLDSAQDQLGAVLWNSNECVSQHLHESVLPKDSPARRGLRVVELGAGVGCLGISLAMAGATVAITDIKELLPLMVHNAALNSRSIASGGGACAAFAWKWGEAPPMDLERLLRGRLDYVLLCDALYGNPKDWPKLIETLNWLSEKFDGCRVINFCEQRVEKVEDAFMTLITSCSSPSWTWSVSDTAVIGTSGLGMPVRVTTLHRTRTGDITTETDKTKNPIASMTTPPSKKVGEKGCRKSNGASAGSRRAEEAGLEPTKKKARGESPK
jgi:predicted nicotinamide N-methyase